MKEKMASQIEIGDRILRGSREFEVKAIVPFTQESDEFSNLGLGELIGVRVHAEALDTEHIWFIKLCLPDETLDMA